MPARRVDPNRYTNPSVIRSIMQQVRLSWRLIRDPRVPVGLKMLIPGLATLYAVSPIDILPDFLVGLGQLDDIGIILAALSLFVKLAPQAVVDEHRAAMGGQRGSAAGGSGFVDADYTVKSRR